MAVKILKKPESMDECLYFTNRTIGENGSIIAWAFKKECPKCHKAKMGKPIENGKKKIRAKEYVCPECGYTEKKEAHEQSLFLNVEYTCPYCGFEGETTIEYKRKNFQGIPAFVFICEKCGKKIGITKKMKSKKAKK